MKNITKPSKANLTDNNFKNTTALKIQNALLLLFLTVSLSSCDAIAGIFKAGMGVGIFIVLAVIILIVLIVRGMGKK